MNKEIEKFTKEILNIETLETRFDGELDFHDIAIWKLKELLEKVYQAGKNKKEGKQ